MKLFNNKNFILFLIVHTLISITMADRTTFLTIRSMSVYSSWGAIGAIGIFSSLPGALVTPIFGFMMDRLNIRKSLLFLSGLFFILTLSLSMLLIFNKTPLIYLLIICSIFSIIEGVFYIFSLSLLPDMVGKDLLAGANSYLLFFKTLPSITSPILGGIIYSKFGLGKLLLLDSLILLLAYLFLILINMPKALSLNVLNSKSIYFEMAGALRYLLNNTKMFRLFIYLLLSRSMQAAIILMVMPHFFKTIVKDENFIFLRVVQFFNTLGAIASGLINGIFFTKKNPFKVYKTYFWFNSLVFGIYSMLLLPNFFNMAKSKFSVYIGIFSVIFFILGITFNSISIFFITIIQKETDNNSINGVLTLGMLASSIAFPIGQFVSSFSVNTFTVYINLVVYNLLNIAFTLIFIKKLYIKD